MVSLEHAGAVATRRKLFLGAAAALVAPVVRAQVLLEDSPSSGSGWMSPRPASEPVIVSAPVAESQVLRTVERQLGAPRDWRDFLLQGERSVLMRRDGPVRRYRYRTADGMVDKAGYAAACHVLRDVRADKMMAMDPALLDVLCGIQRWMEYNGRRAAIYITSGFRTLATNSRTEGAAKDSMHLYGRAADIVIDGATSSLVGAMVSQFNSNGGTGIYLSRGFVHVDTGAARTWVSTGRR